MRQLSKSPCMSIKKGGSNRGSMVSNFKCKPHILAVRNMFGKLKASDMSLIVFINSNLKPWVLLPRKQGNLNQNQNLEDVWTSSLTRNCLSRLGVALAWSRQPHDASGCGFIVNILPVVRCFPLEPFLEINPGVLGSGIRSSWPLISTNGAS